MKGIFITPILIFIFCFAALAQTNGDSCPKIEFTSKSENQIITSYIKVYSVDISKEIEKYDVEYIWSVKGGKILAGQGTKSIAFSSDSDEMSISFEVRGLPKNCYNSISDTWVIDPPYPIKVDMFGKVSQGEKKARLDIFFTALQNNPNSQGLVVISDNRNSVNQLKFINNYIRLRRFDRTRILFVISNETKEQTQFWIIPAGAENPVFENNLTISAQDFEKLENLFRPKPKNRKK